MTKEIMSTHAHTRNWEKRPVLKDFRIFQGNFWKNSSPTS